MMKRGRNKRSKEEFVKEALGAVLCGGEPVSLRKKEGGSIRVNEVHVIGLDERNKPTRVRVIKREGDDGKK